MVAVASNVRPPNIHSSNVRLALFVHKHPSIDVPPSPFIFVDTPYSSNCMSCQNIVASILYCYKIWGHGTTLSLDDENITAQPEPRYQLRSNAQSFKLISLSSWSSRQYHQTFATPPSSNTTPTRNSNSCYITSTVHQNSFGGVNQWVRLMSHLLSHHHRIFHCKPLPLNPYTPWRSTIPLG